MFNLAQVHSPACGGNWSSHTVVCRAATHLPQQDNADHCAACQSTVTHLTGLLSIAVETYCAHLKVTLATTQFIAMAQYWLLWGFSGHNVNMTYINSVFLGTLWSFTVTLKGLWVCLIQWVALTIKFDWLAYITASMFTPLSFESPSLSFKESGLLGGWVGRDGAGYVQGAGSCSIIRYIHSQYNQGKC